MILSGPQKDREKLWMGKSSNIDIGLENREDFKLDYTSENQVYEKELDQLKRENFHLKDQLNRSLKELKSYQIKYPSAYISLEEDEDAEFPQWSVSPESMGPLINAYDTKIRELEDVIKNQTSQLERFNENFQEILSENEKLREAQLESIKHSSNSKSDLSHGGGKRNLEPLAPIDSEILSEMNERVDILMTENALLLEQKSLLRSELQQYQEGLSKRTAEFQESSLKVISYAKEIQSLRNQLNQYDHDKKELEGRLMNIGEIISKSEAEKDEIVNKFSESEMRVNKAEGKINELIKEKKEILVRSEEESYAYMKRTKVAEDRIRELHMQLLKSNQDLNFSQESLRKLKREYQATRQDAEGMLQVMSGLERQLTDFSAREADMERRMKENKDILENALLVKDQAIAREEHNRREVDRLIEERKQAAISRQEEIKEAIYVATERMRDQIKSMDQSLESLTIKNADILNTYEVAIKEKKQDTDQIEKLQQILDEERKFTSKYLKNLEEKMKDIEASKENEITKRIEIQDINKSIRDTLDKVRSQFDNYRLASEQREKSKDLEINEIKTELATLTKSFNETKRLLNRKDREFEDVKKDFDFRMVEVEQKKVEEINQINLIKSELENSIRELEHINQVESQSSSLTIEKMKEKNTTAINFLENKLRQVKETNSQLLESNRILENSTQENQAERSKLVVVIEEARERIRQLQSELNEAHSTISDLSGNITNNPIKKIPQKLNIEKVTELYLNKPIVHKIKVPESDLDFGIINDKNLFSKTVSIDDQLEISQNHEEDSSIGEENLDSDSEFDSLNS